MDKNITILRKKCINEKIVKGIINLDEILNSQRSQGNKKSLAYSRA